MIRFKLKIEALEARSGHRCVADDRNIYVWGGYNPEFIGSENTESTAYPLFKELWKFNLWTKKWKKLHMTGDVPTELASHTVLKIGHTLMHFGGTGVPFGSASTNTVTLLNLNSLEWKKRTCQGDPPVPKYGQTMTLVEHYVYIVGGTTGYEYNMDIHRLDINTFTWERVIPVSKYAPEERYRHEIVYHNRQLYMFAGGTGNTSHSLDKLDVFDVDKLTWDSIQTLPHCHSREISEFPAPRRCHSCTKFKDDVFLFGGMNLMAIMADIWRFNLTAHQWTRLDMVVPVPVYFHSAEVTPDGCLYVFGGVSMIDSERTNTLQKVWLQVPNLKLLCWEVLTNVIDFSHLTDKRESLRHAGIPSHFMDMLL